MNEFEQFVEVEETVEPTETVHGTTVERINKDELVPLWEPHEHVFAPDPTDVTDEFIAEMCTVKNCGIGRLVSK